MQHMATLTAATRTTTAVQIGYYNRARDINLFRASRLCSMPELQFDYFACNAARIMPY
jgi:hypothetical protein